MTAASVPTGTKRRCEIQGQERQQDNPAELIPKRYPNTTNRRGVCSLFTIIAEMIVGFPGFEISLALKAALQITAVNFFLYLAVLPIIALTCRRAGSFLVGVIIAFVYGYGGMFAAGNMTLANLYPITASLGMVGYPPDRAAVHGSIGQQ